jgi:hypothetical protein
MTQSIINSVIRGASEYANIFPQMGAEEFQGLKDSIERNGVLEPVVKFNGKTLDGRHRERAVKELNAEGKRRKIEVANPEGGEPLVEEREYELPVVEFTGTEQEALEYVLAKGVHRRQLTSSQKAVVAVRAMLLGKKIAGRARRRGETLTALNEELAAIGPEGDIASWVAKVGGTNRTYVFRALRIAEATGGNEYLNKVMAGELSINAALAALAEAEAGEGEGEGGEPEVPVVLDGLRRAVPEEFFPAFQTRESFKETDQKLRSLLTEVEQLCDGPGGEWLHQSENLSLIRSLRKNLKEGQPHAVCPKCSGEGSDPENASRPCPLCKRTKYVSKLLYDAHQREAGALVADTSDDDEEVAVETGDPVPASE